MKLLISTIVDYNNYGNRLQNYALEQVLLEKGHVVHTLKRPYYPTSLSMTNRLINFCKSNIFFRVSNKIELVKFREWDLKRNSSFIKFTNELIHETEEYNASTWKDDKLDTYDCFIIGSDQVWNCSFPRFSELDFLTSVSKPKISYAASFGVEKIPEDFHEIYSKGLSGINFISVREEAGKEIVEKLTEKKAEVVLDPTLMLSKNKWLTITQDKPKFSDKYILMYFIDKPLSSTEDYIQKIATKNHYKIRKLGTREDLELWTSDPADFVNLFSQAEAVFTDSFHACVFSIIFEKYFEVFNRNTKLPSMNSRIDTLFNNLDLHDRWHDGNDGITTIDYSKTKKLLEDKMKESNEFLDLALTKIGID